MSNGLQKGVGGIPLGEIGDQARTGHRLLMCGQLRAEGVDAVVVNGVAVGA